MRKGLLSRFFSSKERILQRICLFVTLLILSCAPRYSIVNQYNNQVHEQHGPLNTGTVIVFLVDGLGRGFLEQKLQRKELPNLWAYFATAMPPVHLPMATLYSGFPSLTYPSISSLLTLSTVDQHGIFGNKILTGGKVIDFEEPSERDFLNDILFEKSIFTTLQSRYQKTVSLAHYFNAGSSVSWGDDVKSGLAYLNNSYTYIDEKTLDALNELLKRVKPSLWPRFIFVHLVGLDAVSHRSGPFSGEAHRYMKWLDQALGPTFQTLRKADSTRHQTISLLTSDHGMVDTPVYEDLESLLEDLHPAVKVLNEARYASVYFSPLAPIQEGQKVLISLPKRRTVLATAFRDKAVVHFVTARNYFRILMDSKNCPEGQFAVIRSQTANGPFTCRADFSGDLLPEKDSYQIQRLVSYFRASAAPDGVVFAANGVSFFKGIKGAHGGMLRQEIDSPLLARPFIFQDHPQVRNEELLKFLLNQDPQSSQ